MRWVVRAIAAVVLFAFRPADGVHGQLLIGEPIVTVWALDSQNLIFWDPVRKHYRCYFWDFREGRRDITMASSQEFRHFVLRGADVYTFGCRMPPAACG